MKLSEAQKIVTILTRKYGLPPIKVKEVESSEPGTMAQFDPNEYIIEISAKTELRDISHEFAHYIERLLRVVPPLEEDLCNAFASALGDELINPNEPTPAAGT